MSSSPTFTGGILDDLLDKLYSTPTSTGAPGLPGPTHESTQAVLEALRHDFKSHSPFVNHLKFHKYEERLPESPTLMLNASLLPQSRLSSRLGRICVKRIAGAHQRCVQYTLARTATHTRGPRAHHRGELYRTSR